MNRDQQNRAPIVEALNRFKKMRIVPFDVPGHKRGKGNPELTAFLGEACMSVDVNAMKPLDNLTHPTSVIAEAEELAADAFGAGHAFFIVNGTTAAVQTMILCACRANDKIILPRNVHKSVINALILCGAIPVYVETVIHPTLGIALGMSLDAVRQAMDAHPDAAAILVNNPTYYGICSDIRSITEMAHARGMLVLADEAHGAHLYFGKNLPMPAMAAGADYSSVSMHKSGGSLTQSSFLLTGETINTDYVRRMINLTQTTSASYLLLTSLDLSRKNLALHGETIFAKVSSLSAYARAEINELGDYYAYANELIDRNDIYDFDSTKLSVNTSGIGLTGIEVYDILRDEYDIQVEFGDTANILAYISVGDRLQDLERLVGALSEIRRRYRRETAEITNYRPIHPQVVTNPRAAFYAPAVPCPIADSPGRIAAETIMSYPPGIPILAPGERITAEIIEYIQFAADRGCALMGMEDPTLSYLQVLTDMPPPDPPDHAGE